MRVICSICLGDIGRKEAVSIAVCGHVFDLTCILHCLQVDRKCPLCNQDIFGSTQQEKFIRTYFSTDDADEKATRKLKQQLGTASAEVRRLQSQQNEYSELKVRYGEVRNELERSRELISLLHEKYNNLKIEANMAKLDYQEHQ